AGILIAGVALAVLPARAWNQEHSLARGNHPVNTHHMRELRPARHTNPLKLVYWCLKESTEFRRNPRLPIRIKSAGKGANVLANAYRYPPAILRQVRGSRAAGPQPLHRNEKDGNGCHLLLYGDDVAGLEGEAGGGAHQEYSHGDSQSSKTIPTITEVHGRAETV